MTSTALALRLMLAFVCLTAAVAKLSGRRSFLAFVGELATLGVPPRVTMHAGIAVVGLEAAVVGLAPWPGTGGLVGALIAAGLMSVLTIGVAQSVRRGTEARCRCFGARAGRLTRVHVVRNAILTCAAFLAVALTAMASGAAPDPAGAGIAAAAAVLAAMVVIFFEDAAALFTSPAHIQPPSHR